MTRFFRSLGRSLKLAIILAYGGLQLLVQRPSTYEQRAAWLHELCSYALRTMGISVRCEGVSPNGGVVIANHLGYLDIVVFAALHPCAFVAKSEIRQWPFLGWMTTMAGTVYVDRGRGGSAVRAASGMKAADDAGVPVVFFPEGTTSNGSCVLKFHSGLLMQALEAGQPITATHLGYRLTCDNGPEVTVTNDVNYWGDIPFLLHVFRFLSLRGVEANVRFAASPIVFSCDLNQRKLIAAEARAAVVELAPEPTGVVDG